VKKPRVQKSYIGKSSVLLKVVDGVELRLTQINRLFCVARGLAAFPSLVAGTAVKFDRAGFAVSDAVANAVRTVLRKQNEIRKNWRREEADFEVAWQYS
jgi:hypothetical protein